MQQEPNGRLQPLSRLQTGQLNNKLLEAKTQMVTAVLAGKSCYIQGEDAPLRYRLLTDAALRLAGLGQTAAYFDLIDLDYQYDLAKWVQNSLRLLAIQLKVPPPGGEWWTQQMAEDPIAAFVAFLDKMVLPQAQTQVMLSFDEADQLLKAPLATDFWRLLTLIEAARVQQPLFKNLVVVLWGKTSWEILAGNGRFPTSAIKSIVL